MNNKCVIIIDENLSSGEAANITAIIGITLSNANKNMIGQDVIDRSNIVHKGIITTPVPILKGNTSVFNRVIESNKDGSIIMAGFTSLAQKCKTYDEYIQKMSHTMNSDLKYLGIGLYGNKNLINKLTGNLPLYK